MAHYQTYAAPVGRLLLSLIFIISGLAKLGDISGTEAFIESGGLPGVLVYPTILLELGGGILVLLGYKARLAALGLAGFSVATGILYHLVPAMSLSGMEQQFQMTMFLKNIGLAGGFVMLFATGPGGWSLDRRHGAAAVAT